MYVKFICASCLGHSLSFGTPPVLLEQGEAFPALWDLASYCLENEDLADSAEEKGSLSPFILVPKTVRSRMREANGSHPCVRAGPAAVLRIK